MLTYQFQELSSLNSNTNVKTGYFKPKKSGKTLILYRSVHFIRHVGHYVTGNEIRFSQSAVLCVNLC